ncbi:glycosyltransferase family 4 protein [Reichenbachiella sp.]|uniref:glycosyltransferase family 4 protein n=1 Tax=Reichenbachiella sp. TaxID=2184521 RepID=UPI003B5CE97F
MKKILFIAAHRRDRSPSQRFRFEQYFEYLEYHGFKCELSSLISASDDKYFYASGSYLRKLWILGKGVLKRGYDVIRASNFDIVFVQREGFMTGATFFERMLKKRGNQMIFDFDDSIWLQDDSPVNKKLAWLKDAGKTSKLIRLSDLVFAGNEYLAKYARQFNENVEIVPTTIDTIEYQPNRSKNEAVIIGWSGSFSTVKHFESAIPALEKIQEKYGKSVQFKLIGDGDYRNEKLGIIGLAWSKEDEIRELAKIDIGIMPLPDDEWSKGKCGLKGLQYMALKIPTIMSPVGVNADIVNDGKNGFLASNTNEWVDKLSMLIESEELRLKLGQAGRNTVEKKYSVLANQSKYLELINRLIS